MSSSDNSYMVSVTGVNDPVALPTALTAPISALLPPTSGALTTTTSMAATSQASSSLSSSLPESPLISSSSNLASSLLSSPISTIADGTPTLPPSSTADLAATIQLLHHLLTNLHLHPKDIATLLTNSPPLSAISHLLTAGAASPLTAAGAATLIAGLSSSLPHHSLTNPNSTSAHNPWFHSNSPSQPCMATPPNPTPNSVLAFPAATLSSSNPSENLISNPTPYLSYPAAPNPSRTTTHNPNSAQSYMAASNTYPNPNPSTTLLAVNPSLHTAALPDLSNPNTTASLL